MWESPSSSPNEWKIKKTLNHNDSWDVWHHFDLGWKPGSNCQERVNAPVLWQQLASLQHPGFGYDAFSLSCLSTCKVIDVASLWVETKPDLSQPSLQSHACDSMSKTCKLSVCPPLLFGFPYLWPWIGSQLFSELCLSFDYGLIMTILNLACLVPGLLLNHSACLPTASTCLLCSVRACPGVVVRHYSIVYKTWGQPSTCRPACLMGNGAAISEEHRSQL